MKKKKKSTIKKGFTRKKNPQNETAKKAVKKVEKPKVIILDPKEIPTADNLKGKSLEELDIIWSKILESENGLNRKAENFYEIYMQHVTGLRLINLARTEIKKAATS